MIDLLRRGYIRIDGGNGWELYRIPDVDFNGIGWANYVLVNLGGHVTKRRYYLGWFHHESDAAGFANSSDSNELLKRGPKMFDLLQSNFKSGKYDA